MRRRTTFRLDYGSFSVREVTTVRGYIVCDPRGRELGHHRLLLPAIRQAQALARPPPYDVRARTAQEPPVSERAGGFLLPSMIVD